MSRKRSGCLRIACASAPAANSQSGCGSSRSSAIASAHRSACRIESEFAALRYFALIGTDHRTHAEQNAAIAACIRRRDARAEPKTNFAPDSPIRQWTEYPAKAA